MQKELEQQVKNLEANRDNLLESLEICTGNLKILCKESIEFRQKLQQLFKEIEPFIFDFEGSKKYFLNKFEDLLKEVKEA